MTSSESSRHVPQAAPSEIAERQVRAGDFEWFYRYAEPTGETRDTPVVLLHGLPATGYSWRYLLPKLARGGWRAIAPDWLGFGRSAKPERGDFAYTPEAFLAQLEAFLAALGCDRVVLFVQGFLGSVGLQFAQRHPERIERLVILNAPLTATARLPWRMRQWGIPLLGDMLTQDPLQIDRTLEGGSGYQIADDDLAVYRSAYLRSSKAGRSLAMTVQKLQLAQALAELQIGWGQWQRPTLLIWGEADPWLDATEAAAIAQTASNIEMFALPEAKHYPQEHWSDEMIEAAIDFLRVRER